MPRLRDAPITAMLAGVQHLPTAATAAILSRSWKRSSARGAIDVGNSISIASGVALTSTSKPLSRNTSIIAVIHRQHFGHECREPLSVPVVREVRQQDCRDPPAVPGVGDEKRDLGPVAVDSDVPRVGDDLRGRPA